MKKRRILLALIMLIISGISLTTATYAWFTANRAVSVEEIDVKAQASGGIQISADATNWSNQVTLTQLRAEALTNNYIPDAKNGESLRPVTTIGVNQTTGKFDFFLGELNDAGDKVTLTAVEDAAKNYIAFDLYFYSANPQEIEFNAGTNVIAKNVSGSGDAVDAGLKSSVRVGFLVQGTDGTSTPATAIALNGGTVANQTIWEPYAEVHTAAAVTLHGATQGQIMDTYGGKLAAADAVDRNGTTNSTNFAKIDNALGLKTSSATQLYPSGTIFNFPAGISKVRVYIWLEGQDVDNEDTASLGTGVGVQLNFKLKDTNA